eukprot:scaffold34504_cov36-Tisochrysis_lutea.AAC.4
MHPCLSHPTCVLSVGKCRRATIERAEIICASPILPFRDLTTRQKIRSASTWLQTAPRSLAARSIRTNPNPLRHGGAETREASEK